MIFAAFASFIFAVDSFRRLNKYMEDHDNVGITRRQIIVNMVVSFLTSMSILALMGSVIAADTRHVSGVLQEANILQLMIRMDGLSLGLLIISSLPINYIINRLLD
jgi:hypothetical protein